MPAAAVIPAPIAYIKVVAVKKARSWISRVTVYSYIVLYQSLTVTVRKLECFKQAIAGIH